MATRSRGGGGLGKAHAAYATGGTPLCGSKTALVSYAVAKFRQIAADSRCSRCAAKVAEVDKRAGARKPAGVIDLTPTWSAVLPLYLAAVCDGTYEAANAARSELARMAQLADAQVKTAKAVA